MWEFEKTMKILGSTDFPLWGERDYVQSCHMLDNFFALWSSSKRPPIERLVAEFKTFVRCNGIFAEIDNPRQQDSPLFLRVQNAEDVTVVAFEPNDNAIQRSLPDDEADLIAGAHLRPGEREGDLETPNFQRLIGAMVALVKLVHNASLPSDGYSRWYLAGCDLNLALMRTMSWESMTAQIDRVVGARMTMSTVLCGGLPVAKFNFIREALP
jgi:hypothetical protein